MINGKKEIWVKAKIYTPEHNKHISDAKRGKYGNSKQNPNR